MYPVNMDVISWLGAFHVRNEVYEKALPYFDLASKIQPQEVKWSLMVASCYRRVMQLPQVGLHACKAVNVLGLIEHVIVLCARVTGHVNSCSCADCH